ncbi:MAG: hypothetical protein ACRCUE_20575, partial [Bosea sp. (in: a-proteobacteria)]
CSAGTATRQSDLSVKFRDCTIRRGSPLDEDSLYAISLATGHQGGDAAALYDDPKLMGLVYSVPYLRLSEGRCFVVEVDGAVAGFAVGTPDTRLFEQALQTHWWPALRQSYPDPKGVDRENWTADQRRISMFYHPELAPSEVVMAFPAHMHLNLLPVVQGRGIGQILAEQMLKLIGDCGTHVGVNGLNKRALGFWSSLGFEEIPIDSVPLGRTTWLGARSSTALCR